MLIALDANVLMDLAAKDESRAEALAQQLGPLARAASVEDAIDGADVVVFAVWLDTIRELIAKHARLLEDKVVIDPSNPLGFDEGGQMIRTLPEGQSSGSAVASLLPAGAHYVKAFGTLVADALASGANREPRRAVLFYATDDDVAATMIERLIRAAGFEPLKAGGLADAGRLEVPGGESSESFAARLLEHGLIVSPGTFFGPAGEGYWRLALVPTEDECRRAASILEEIL